MQSKNLNLGFLAHNKIPFSSPAYWKAWGTRWPLSPDFMLINLWSYFMEYKGNVKICYLSKRQFSFSSQIWISRTLHLPSKHEWFFFAYPFYFHRGAYMSHFLLPLFQTDLLFFPHCWGYQTSTRHAQYLWYCSIMYAKESNTKYLHQQFYVFNSTFHTAFWKITLTGVLTVYLGRNLQTGNTIIFCWSIYD